MTIDNDPYLSMYCDPAERGCGAQPGEPCSPSCTTNDPEQWDDFDYDTIEWVDADAQYDRIVDVQLGVA